MFKIEINTENAAFDEHLPGHEVARILRVLANRIQAEGLPGIGRAYKMADVNGNTVGRAEGD